MLTRNEKQKMPNKKASLRKTVRPTKFKANHIIPLYGFNINCRNWVNSKRNLRVQNHSLQAIKYQSWRDA